MDRPTPLVVLNVVGLNPSLLEHMPNLRRTCQHSSRLEPILPAVTCSMQATLLTGEMPREHGIVGNGWYFRDLGEVLLWRQHHALMGGEKLWQAARQVYPDYTVANVCWWYAMGADVNWTVTPRPIYRADGRKEPDCYTFPADLHDELPVFPLFSYWGPGAGIASSKWIAETAQHLMRTRQPDLTLVYLPHLDYDLQRFGPHGPEAIKAAVELDEAIAPMLGDCQERGATVVALSEYAITPADQPVHINKLLREHGLLNVHTQDGMEYLDPWTSRAFAVADHQIAHVYVRDEADLATVAKLCADLKGVAKVLDAQGKAEHGLDHPRSGELVLVAEPPAWFTYYYWLDPAMAPDFATHVEIHRKPGYDPAELLFDPAGPGAAKGRAAKALLKKKLGMRYRMNVVGLEAGASAIRGSHGMLPQSAADAPVFLSSQAEAAPAAIAATEVKKVLLRLAGLTP
ncbi:nucleotide pyrophosphatase/phosphodiesterase family protein [Catelliglobosispora koreensis]|uniref:nucleotide pyrophosphatase/phosphodiesterase family protein n=1 Tax=Catelliglobosispora koreensis TaxID=129052 RepID=UPI0003818EDB|nr:nucleotide pyrophosphatase/phosphodiesterase family protein [Catelliglobosispora koreensis]